MEVLAAIFLFSFVGVVCFGMIALLFKAISAIFENRLLEDVCEIGTKICLANICLATTVILFAVALLLLVGVGAASFVAFSEGA